MGCTSRDACWSLPLSPTPLHVPLAQSGCPSNPADGAYHSSGRGYTVCRRALSGSYSKDTPAVGFHLACSLPKPFLAYARRRSSCPFRSFTSRMSAGGRRGRRGRSKHRKTSDGGGGGYKQGRKAEWRWIVWMMDAKADAQHCWCPVRVCVCVFPW